MEAPISDSNENHIENVEFEEVIALSDSEYSDTDSPSESVDYNLCSMNFIMTLLVTWNNCINYLFLNVTIFSNIKDYSRSPEDSFRNSLLVYLKIKQKAWIAFKKIKKLL